MTLIAKPPETLLSIWGYTRARRIKEGKCPNCGGEVEGDVRRTASGTKKRMCRSCLKKNAERMGKERSRRKKLNLCTRCGKRKPQKDIQQCKKCRDYSNKKTNARVAKTFFDKRTRSGGGPGYSVLNAKMLWSLWKEQRGRCALTGIRLNKENAQLDHIIPKSKGGGNERFNLRWTTIDVNQAKRALSDIEFLNLCKSVLDYAALKGKK